MKKYLQLVAILLVLTLALTGCGGKYEPVNSFNGQAFTDSLQGLFSGTIGTATSINLLTSTGYYSIYSTGTGSSVIVGTGAPSSPDSTFRGSLTDFGTIPPTPGGLVFTPGDNILTGTILETSGSAAANLVRLPTTQYISNTPASILEVLGNWNGSGGNLFFSFDGSITGNLPCPVTGTATPDGSHNFFAITLKLCSGNFTGVGAVYQTPSGTPQLLIIGTVPPTGGATYPSAFTFIGS